MCLCALEVAGEGLSTEKTADLDCSYEENLLSGRRGHHRIEEELR